MSQKKINILVFPAGSEIAIEIYHSLKYNLHVEIFGASGKADHSKFIYDEQHYFEDEYYVDRPDFINKFNSLLDRLKIDMVFPTHDTVALFLAEHQQKINSKVLTSSFNSAKIAREKKLIYDLFRGTDFCPEIYQEPFDKIRYPVFLKPNIGQGGKGTSLVNNRDMLLSSMEANPDILPCEYLPGEELSIDCFTNRHRELLFVGPRTRERVQMGISFHSVLVPLTEEIQAIAQRINEMVVIRGTWFFQLKKDINGKYKLLEFAVRQASTMGLYRQLGVNFALLSIFDMMDMDVKVIKNSYHIELDRCLYNRYKIDFEYDSVYVDFDDTIIINDKVNEMAMKYLFFCKNSNIKIILLTKHRFDLNKSLDKYGISKKLFDEIILIDINDDKSKYIETTKSIFIDNYFFDRYKVQSELGIPVFDVDAIESLIL